MAGEDVLRPILDDFMEAFPAVAVRLYLLDRPVQLIEEGVDVALRIEHLNDSSLIALPVGEVRRVVVASPRYLAAHPRILEPADLAKQQIIAMSHFGLESWNFPPLPAHAHVDPCIFSSADRQQRESCHRLCRRWPWRHPALLLSSYRQAA